jgi:toxin ParE1/3/4
MVHYKLTVKADEDLVNIFHYSLLQFGLNRAETYLTSLEEHFLTLAHSPELGRRIDHIRQGYFRYEHLSHIIFYKNIPEGVLIVRVLHQSVDVPKHIP